MTITGDLHGVKVVDIGSELGYLTLNPEQGCLYFL